MTTFDIDIFQSTDRWVWFDEGLPTVLEFMYGNDGNDDLVPSMSIHRGWDFWNDFGPCLYIGFQFDMSFFTVLAERALDAEPPGICPDEEDRLWLYDDDDLNRVVEALLDWERKIGPRVSPLIKKLAKRCAKKMAKIPSAVGSETVRQALLEAREPQAELEDLSLEMHRSSLQSADDC